MWYQDSLRRFQVPERIEDAPSLQAGFRAAAERFAKVTEGPRRRDGGVGSPTPCAGT
jgi:hypothetical protein